MWRVILVWIAKPGSIRCKSLMYMGVSHVIVIHQELSTGNKSAMPSQDSAIVKPV